ncbi:hypothetical protein B9Z55_027284 [Caenorhabditis nigoni]|uniref:Uncharacterized protein n=1 Tax=Caenorhabditis nigoni TaxID=1611254 RepID=A0A2G5SHE4_9PELO|nr:hypothetical protein B9Z55_027284 [Caenorhabditis nigoni]
MPKFLLAYNSETLIGLKEADPRIYYGRVVFDTSPKVGLYAATIATIPDKEALPAETFEKYRGKVWSPYFGFLDDPQNLFADKDPKVLHPVFVRFVEKEETDFEIFDFEPPYPFDIIKELLINPPWTEEEGMLPDRRLKRHPSELVQFHSLVPIPEELAVLEYGICVEVDVRNAFYNETSAKYAKKCHHIFTIQFGLIRCFHKAEAQLKRKLRDFQLGKWYKLEVFDARKLDRPRGATKKTHFRALTVKKLVEIDTRLVTDVVDGVVQFKMPFIYDHDLLEKRKNLKIGQGWETRTIRDDAYCWDEYLGKVRILEDVAMKLIQKVESYRSVIQKKYWTEATAMIATVKYRTDGREITEWNYSSQGLFVMTEMLEMRNFENTRIY